MPAILKIGYRRFLVKSENAAIAALKALSEAVEVDSEYSSKHGEVYFPHARAENGIEIKIVKAGQIRRCKPVEEVETIPAERQLPYEGKVFYQGDGKEGAK